MLEIRLNGAGVSFCRQPTNKPFFHSNLRNFSNCRESFWKFLQNTMASGNRFPTSLAKCCKIFYPFPAEQSQSFRSALQTPAPKKTNGEIPPKFYRNYIREGEEEDCKSARKKWKRRGNKFKIHRNVVKWPEKAGDVEVGGSAEA